MYADDTQDLVVVEANYATVGHTMQYARLGLFYGRRTSTW
jgi:hypothetical protein